MKLGRGLGVVVLLGSMPVFAGVIVTALAGYTSPTSPGFLDTSCSMTSSGSLVTCTLVVPPNGSNLTAGASATSSAAFGTNGGSIHIDSQADRSGFPVNNDAHSMASASFDELLLIPGTGTATIIGHYSYSVTDPFNNFRGSLNQTGTTLAVPGAIGPIVGTLLVTSTIRLGVPFEVTGMLQSLANTIDVPDISSASVDFQNFTDQAGNTLAYQVVVPEVVVPEPNPTALIGVILLGLFSANLMRQIGQGEG
jgi:hypothetical protein